MLRIAAFVCSPAPSVRLALACAVMAETAPPFSWTLHNLRVQSAAHQAAVHRGVWQTDVQVAERIQPQIVRFFEVRVAAATA